MLSIRPVNAGSGYEYLMRSVATNDAPAEQQKLSDYYAAKGTPPGRWMGSGLAGFGTDKVVNGGEITELQMAALYGEGLHPESDEMVKNGKGLEQCTIGRPFPYFTNNDPALTALREAERAFRINNDAVPTAEERAEIAVEVGSPHFMDAHGVPPANKREVLDWINAKRQNVKQACAGYDFTFSPVKSVSVLWALSDEQTAARIAECHHKAVAEAMAWAEDEVIRTRKGAGGIKQVKTQGIIATEFTHFDTRLGDPDLHSHVLVSNKVQDEEGKWLSLDGRTIFRFHQAMGFRYNSLMADILNREMGLEFIANDRGEGKEAVWEVKGVDPQLLDQFSKRRAGARPVYDRMVADYIEKHGVAPSKRVVNRLWQQAILDTRSAKRPAESLSALRENWMEEIRGLDNGKDLLNSLNSALNSGAKDQRPVFNFADHSHIIDDALDTVIRRRSTFRRSHIHTAVASKLMAFRFESTAHRDQIQDQVVDKLIDQHGISLNSSEELNLPQQLTDDAGYGIDKLLDSETFTTAEVLEAEQKALDAVLEPVAVFASNALVSEELAAHTKREGWSLNDGQQALSRHLLTCGTLAATGVGPAGTGKTASMKLVTSAWQKTGGKVIGLAPSAAAAKVLSTDIDAPASTIDSLTFVWNGKHPSKRGHDVSELPIEINPGDMLLVDEAGMASTTNISALIDIAKAAGAVVRFIGDPKQLDAVESGGLFGAMTRTGRTVTLTDVMRFKDDTEQSDASLKIREGDPEGLDLHFDRAWVTGGARESMLADAAQDYLHDTAMGRQSLLLASTNADVAALNEMIRSVRIENNEVNDEHTLSLTRGEICGVGDVVLARKNSVFTLKQHGISGRVSNGDLFTVEEITEAGELIVVDNNTGDRKTLPADYVNSNVQLGYASTVHRAQGATVDVARAVIDQSVDRAGLYVALTRGKYATYTYAVTEHVLDEAAEDAHYHHGGNDAAPTARDVLEKVLEKDNHQTSAIETLWQNVDEATAPERKRSLWIHGHDLAVDQFVSAHLNEVVESLSEVEYRALMTTGDGLKPVDAAWRILVKAGVDPRPLTQEALRHCDDYKDLGRLLAHKLRQHIPEEPDTFSAPPLSVLTDMELTTWVDNNREEYLNGKASSTSVATDVVFTEGDAIEDQNFAGFDFHSMDLRGVKFENCDFTGARFDQAQLNLVTFTRCRLDDVSFADASLQAVNFSMSHMEGTSFAGATMGADADYSTKVDFLSVDGKNMSFAHAVIHMLEVTWSRFKNLDLRGAAANFATFLSSDLTGARADHTTTTSFMSELRDCDVDTDLPITSTSTGASRFEQSQLPQEYELPAIQTQHQHDLTL